MVHNMAFTKRWALFCAGRDFTEADLVYRNRILEGEDFRKREFARASIRFCSIFVANLSGSRILKGGDFTGNGWEACSFSGAEFAGLTMEMERYERCVLGNAVFYSTKMQELCLLDCSCVGSCFENIRVRKCVFERCVFRNSFFQGIQAEQTTFRECIFDGAYAEDLCFSGVVFQKCRFRGQKKERGCGCIYRGCTFVPEAG